MAFPGTDLDIIIQAYLGADPTADPGSWPSPTDLSSRLLRNPIQSRRGRGQNQKTASAGACTFWLDNTDGALTPLLATSTYYPDWDLGVPVDLSVDNVGASPPYVRHAGFVAEVAAVMVPGVGGENISAVRVTSSGVLRRLTQGAVPKSAQLRFYTNVSPQPLAYWPLEDGNQQPATKFSSGLSGGRSLRVAQSTLFGVARPFSAASGVTPGPAGSAGATDVHAGGYLQGPVTEVESATTARAEMSMLADGFENTFPILIRLRVPGVTYIGVACSDLGPGHRLGVIWANLSLSGDDYTTDPFGIQDNQFHFIQLDASSSGGGADTAYVLRVDGVTVKSGTATGLTWAVPTQVDVNALATDVDQVAHVAAWSGTSLPTAADSYDAYLGHPGEEAHDRIERLCAEDGIPYSGTATESIRCGPQPVADVVGVLQDAETVDHGMLVEDFAFGLNYRAGSQRQNLAASMTVDLSTYKTTSGTQGDVLAPVRNDARIRNEWKISSPTGAAVTAVDETHQARHGRFNDSATVNVANDDNQLADEAQWRVHEGTFAGLRYDVIPLDLGGERVTLLDNWLEMDLGDRVDRTNHLAEHPGDDVQLQIEGYSETIRHRGWDVKLNAEPFSVWEVGEYAANDADAGDEPVSRYDTAGCETAAGIWLPSGWSGDVSTPDNAALDITGDLDLRADVTPESWASGVIQTLLSKYASGTNRSYALRINTTGLLNLLYSTDGTANTSVDSTEPVAVHRTRLAVRATIDVNNGAGGRTVTFYTGTATGGLDDTDVTWVQLGDPVITAGTVTIFSGNEPLEVGDRGGVAQPFNGIVHAIQVRNGISGTVVAHPRFDQQTTGTTSFSNLGLTWTLTSVSIYNQFVSGTDTKILVSTNTSGGQPWTTDSDDLPMDLRVSGAVLEVTAVTATGKPQLLTVTQAAVNGVVKVVEPGSAVSLARPVVYAL